jgi:hypothetical protein
MKKKFKRFVLIWAAKSFRFGGSRGERPEWKWSRQPGLFAYAKSHWSDPETTRQAAESIGLEKISETQKRVIEVFQFNGWEMSGQGR